MVYIRQYDHGARAHRRVAALLCAVAALGSVIAGAALIDRSQLPAASDDRPHTIADDSPAQRASRLSPRIVTAAIERSPASVPAAATAHAVSSDREMQQGGSRDSDDEQAFFADVDDLAWELGEDASLDLQETRAALHLAVATDAAAADTALAAYLRKPHGAHASLLASALADSGNPQVEVAALDTLHSAAPVEERAAALGLIAQLPAPLPRSRRAMLDVVLHEDDEVLLAAGMRALVRAGRSSAIDRRQLLRTLVPLLRHPDGEVSAAARELAAQWRSVL